MAAAFSSMPTRSRRRSLTAATEVVRAASAAAATNSASLSWLFSAATASAAD